MYVKIKSNALNGQPKKLQKIQLSKPKEKRKRKNKKQELIKIYLML